MHFKLPAIGIVFDLDVLTHGYEAVTLFMKHTDPKRLGMCILASGDVLRPTSEVVHSRYDYCVAISGDESAISYVKTVFQDAELNGLAPRHRRVIDKPLLDRLGLTQDGHIDFAGRLVTDEWLRIDHDRCCKAGWGYDPRVVNYELNPELTAQLAELRRPR